MTKHVTCHDKTMHYACHDKHIFVATKALLWKIFVTTNVILSWQNFCHDKLTFVATNTCLSWKKRLLSLEKYACCDKTFVMTNTCLSKHIFVTTKFLSWQTCSCHGKHNFVMTNVLSQQAYFCHSKRCVLFVAGQNVLNKHAFVEAKLLSWQKWYLWHLLLMLLLPLLKNWYDRQHWHSAATAAWWMNTFWLLGIDQISRFCFFCWLSTFLLVKHVAGWPTSCEQLT